MIDFLKLRRRIVDFLNKYASREQLLTIAEILSVPIPKKEKE